MDTNVYRYVIAVAEHGSISAAARKLFMSQPALTKQISRLEQQLGVRLFERNKTPVTVTPSGAVFLEFASKYLELENEFRKRMEAVKPGGAAKVTVATTNRGGGYVGSHTAPFLIEYPDIQLEYLDASADECEALLENETAELAVYTDPVISDKIEYMPLEEDQLILVVPRGSRALEGVDISDNSLENLAQISPEVFADPDLVYVLSTPNHSLYYAECAFLKKHKITPGHALRVDYVDTRFSIASGGGGIVLVPTTTVRKTPEQNYNAVYCTVKGERMYRYIIIARKKGRTLSAGAEIFWKFMVEQRFRV